MSRIRVLVVDDSHLFLQMISDNLTADDIDTRSASSGAEALDILANEPIDCVVSDYRMPDMNGIELYERIQDAYGLPFILLTGEGDEQVASEAISTGVDEYMIKDAVFDTESENLELLLNRIRNIVASHRTRQKYERLINSSPDEIIEVTIDGDILTANAAAAKSVNESANDLPGKHLSDILPEEVASERLTQARRAVKSGNSVTFQDGIGIRQFHNIAVPLSGAETSVQLVTREITQQKRYEQQLETKTEELALINRLVRHDINNEVQLLIAWAGRLDPVVEGDDREYLERINDSCSHISELTSIARDFIKSLETDDRMELEAIRISDIIRSEVEKKQTKFDQATITISGTIPTETVQANELLTSVIANLLSNAVRHNDKETPQVTVTARDQGETIRVEVADNGPGVPDDRTEEIFGKGEMGPESPGTGIGLYLVHTLVSQYGGDIWVEDNDPEGAVFVLSLPKHE